MSDVLGLDRQMHEAYRVLIEERECSAADVADRLGVTRSFAEQTLQRLAAAGLIAPANGSAAADQATDSASPTVVAIDPRQSLGPLLARKQAQLAAQQQELARAHDAVAALAAAYCTRDQDEAEERPVRQDLTKGIIAVRSRVEELLSSATNNVICVLGEGTRTLTLDVRTDLIQRTLDRGVTIKVLCARRLAADPEALAHARWLISSGGHVRTAAIMPPSMLVIDGAVALVPADGQAATALVVRNRALAGSLHTLFDHVWGHSRAATAPVVPEATVTPIPDGQREPTRVELDLLRLLGKGMTDASAARHLGVSLRTVRRMMAELMGRLEARSRFEAGICAAERGWVGTARQIAAPARRRRLVAG